VVVAAVVFVVKYEQQQHEKYCLMVVVVVVVIVISLGVETPASGMELLVPISISTAPVLRAWIVYL